MYSDRGFPAHNIGLIKNWYGKLVSMVRWGNVMSDVCYIGSGVRQGEVLSPWLFNLYRPY